MKVGRVKTSENEFRMCAVTDGEVFILRDKRYSGRTGFIKLLSDAVSKGNTLDEYVRSLIKSKKMSKKLVGTTDLNQKFVIPYVPPEIWGAGVTYLRSRDAREEETKMKGIYEMVYEAVRPEIFLKTTGLRVVGPGDYACIRSDSNWSVPEPELATVLGFNQEIVGYTIGNDLSARDIEGQNPLYLPQAKIYNRCCSIGPVIATPETIQDPMNLQIEMRIYRHGTEVFRGSVNTRNLRRSIDELISFLCRDNIIAPGTILLTGTGIVPPDEFALQDGDSVEITIEGIGTLTNPIVKLKPQDKPF